MRREGLGTLMVENAPTPPIMMKAHCPRCNDERNCDIHGSFNQPWEWNDELHSENGQMDHRLLQCRGCETVFYWKSSWDTQDIDLYYDRQGNEQQRASITIETYPKPEKQVVRPEWVWSLHKRDITLAAIMGEVYQARDLVSFILGSVGLRTALDRCAELLGIDPAISMEEKVKRLQAGGWIGETEAMTLEVVAQAGNAAAHRGWSPRTEEFSDLLHTLEQFIERALLSGKKALDVAPNIPAKQKRQPKAPRMPGNG